jgi:hypothetical protein
MPNFAFLMLTNGDTHHSSSDIVNSMRYMSTLLGSLTAKLICQYLQFFGH